MIIDESSREPSHDEMENLFVNNAKLVQLQRQLSQFNPIKVMKMERMEIRHSAILAWLLDPSETHGLGDEFLKAFLGEALRGNSSFGSPTALEISQSDLRDAEVRCEWQNIDIFVQSQRNGWAFIIENKFGSKQHSDQLNRYAKTIETILEIEKTTLKVHGIFLSLDDEEPKYSQSSWIRFAPTKYEEICNILPQMLTLDLAPAVKIFLEQYLDILREATGMSEQRTEMEQLARQLYRDHKKVLDFVIEHGASSDFAIAIHGVFGDDPDQLKIAPIAGIDFAFVSLTSNTVGLVPQMWIDALKDNDQDWSGCEKWWGGFPVTTWMRLDSGADGAKGTLSLIAEVGPINDHELRVSLIGGIAEISKESNSKRKIGFQNGATLEGKRYSRFFKSNRVPVDDIQDHEMISAAIVKLVAKFKEEISDVADVLARFNASENDNVIGES